MADERKDTKFVFECKDYLPDGWTFDRIIQTLDDKPVELTKENLAKIVDPKYLNMTEEDLHNHIAQSEENMSIFPKQSPMFNAPKMAYAENLDENDELNQDFPEPEEDK